MGVQLLASVRQAVASLESDSFRLECTCRCHWHHLTICLLMILPASAVPAVRHEAQDVGRPLAPPSLKQRESCARWLYGAQAAVAMGCEER